MCAVHHNPIDAAAVDCNHSAQCATESSARVITGIDMKLLKMDLMTALALIVAVGFIATMTTHSML
jgi:hypothetical protein